MVKITVQLDEKISYKELQELTNKLTDLVNRLYVVGDKLFGNDEKKKTKKR